MEKTFSKNTQFYKFCLYGFLKNLRFYEPFLLLYLLDTLNNNYSQAFTLYSIRYIIRTLLEIPSGVIADALGRKGSLIFAYSFYIFSFLTYYLADSFVLLLIPTVFFGIADSFRTGTHKAMIIEYLKLKNWLNNRTYYYGYTRAWSQIGSAISSLLAVAIIFSTKNYDFVFIATTIPYILGLILILSYPNNIDRRSKSNTPILSKVLFSMNNSWKTLRKPGSIKLLFQTSFYSGFHNTIKDLLQPIIVAAMVSLPFTLDIEHSQRNSTIIGIVYFIVYILSSVASRHSGKISNLFKNQIKAINNLSSIGITFCLIISIFLTLDFPHISALIFLPFFPILSIQRPIAVSCISQNIDNKIMATTLSIESQLGSITASFLSLLMGILIQTFSLGTGILFVSLLALILNILFSSIESHKK